MSTDQQQDISIAAYEQNADKMKSHVPYPQGQMQCYPQGQQHVMIMAPPVPMVTGPVKDHLIWSVFNLVLLCPILGLVAVIYSALSRNNKKLGNDLEARGQGEVAFGLNIAGTVLGVLWWICFIIGLALALTVFSGVEKIVDDFDSVSFAPYEDYTTRDWNWS